MPRRPKTTDGGRLALGRFSDPAVLILTSLAAGPRHGYGLVKDVEAFAGVTLVPGTLYGALDRLAAHGFVRRLPAVDRRHPYEITAAGVAALREHVASIEQVTATAAARLGPQPRPRLRPQPQPQPQPRPLGA